MHTKYVIWGGAGHARVLSDLIELNGDKVIAFFDQCPLNSPRKKIPIFHADYFQEWIRLNKNTTTRLSGSIAIGHCSPQRINLLKKLQSYGIKTPPITHPQAYIAASAKIGYGTQILAQTVVSSDVFLGNGVIVNHRASIDHECIVGDGSHIAPGATLCGCITLGKHVFIGAGAVVLPGIKIGDGSIIGAGSVVTKDVPSDSIFLGSPARQKITQ